MYARLVGMAYGENLQPVLDMTGWYCDRVGKTTKLRMEGVHARVRRNNKLQVGL